VFDWDILKKQKEQGGAMGGSGVAGVSSYMPGNAH
jgi:hypothetical protein